MWTLKMAASLVAVLIAVVATVNAQIFDDLDYYNGKIGTGLVAAATSFAVNEVRTDGWWMGVTTSLSYSACRSCGGQIYQGDRLHLVTDIYQRSTASDTYDSLLENGTPRLKSCYSVLTVQWVTPPSFKLNYMECTDDTASNEVELPGEQSGQKRSLIGGWTAADVNSDGVVNASLFAASAFNQQSNAMRLFSLHFVTSASTQVVAGINYRLDLILRSSSCRKSSADAGKAAFECDLQDSGNNTVVEFQRCSVLVWDQAWQTPRYQVSKLTCKYAGQAVARQGKPGWFESQHSRFKLGISDWTLLDSTSTVQFEATEAQDAVAIDTDVQTRQPDTDWFAAFSLAGKPALVAKQFRSFSTLFNRSYVSTQDSNLAYFRFTQNAARVTVATLGDVGSAVYDLRASRFADLSLGQFCASLPASDTVGNEDLQPLLPFLQFYKSYVVRPWKPIFDTAVYRLVVPSADLCNKVAVREAQCGEKACRKPRFAAQWTSCFVSFCTVETLPTDPTSSDRFAFLSAVDVLRK